MVFDVIAVAFLFLFFIVNYESIILIIIVAVTVAIVVGTVGVPGIDTICILRFASGKFPSGTWVCLA